MELFGYYIPDGKHDLKNLKRVAKKRIFDGGGYNRVKCCLYKGKSSEGKSFLLPVIVGGNNDSFFWFVQKTKSVMISENDILFLNKKNHSMTRLRRRPKDGGYSYNYGDVNGGKDSFQCSLGTEFAKLYKDVAKEEGIKPLPTKKATSEDIIAKAEAVKKALHADDEVNKPKVGKKGKGVDPKMAVLQQQKKRA